MAKPVGRSRRHALAHPPTAPNLHRAELTSRAFVLGRFPDAGPQPRRSPSAGRHPETFTFLVIYAKIMLWVLLSVAPVFITLLLFNVTSRYFHGWMSALVQFVILPVLVYTLLGFFLTIMKDAVQTLNDVNGSAGTTLKEIAPVVLAAFIGFFIMTQTISLSALIAGGSHLGLPRFSPMAAMAWRQSGGRAVNLARNGTLEIAAARGSTREGRALAVRRDYVDTQFRVLQDRRTAINQQLKNR